MGNSTGMPGIVVSYSDKFFLYCDMKLLRCRPLKQLPLVIPLSGVGVQLRHNYNCEAAPLKVGLPGLQIYFCHDSIQSTGGISGICIHVEYINA